jgi:hypothetical protein
MARELKRTDVSQTPDVLRLAEEVQRTRQPRLLQRDREDLAIIIPVAPRGQTRTTQEQALDAQIWADVGVTDPGSIWANYDPDQVKAALQQVKGALAGIDRKQLLDDIYEAREQASNTRPT